MEKKNFKKQEKEVLYRLIESEEPFFLGVAAFLLQKKDFDLKVRINKEKGTYSVLFDLKED